MSGFNTRNGGVNGKLSTSTIYSSSGVWDTRAQQQLTGSSKWPVTAIPPITDFIGWYDASSFSNGIWFDKTSNGYNALITSGTATVGTTANANGATKAFSYVAGTTATQVFWPYGILPSTYTFFHVARYAGTASRIFTSSGNNWLSGFWGGFSGVAYHEGWLTQSSSSIHGSNWLYSTDQNSLYRSNGTQRGTGGGASTRLCINTGTYSETSDWNIAEVIIYNRTLSSGEYTSVEAYLSQKYGI